MLTHQVDFLETTFQPLGVLAHQIFTRASDSLRLTSAHKNGDRGPTKIFEDEQHLKFGLKLSVLASITLGVMGVTLANFSR